VVISGREESEAAERKGLFGWASCGMEGPEIVQLDFTKYVLLKV